MLKQCKPSVWKSFEGFFYEFVHWEPWNTAFGSLLNHKLLEAERTFWSSVTACFSLLVRFSRCIPERTLSQVNLCSDHMVILACLSSTVNHTWKNPEGNKILFLCFPHWPPGQETTPTLKRHCKTQFLVCWDTFIKCRIHLYSIPTQEELFLMFLTRYNAQTILKLERVGFALFFFFP